MLTLLIISLLIVSVYAFAAINLYKGFFRLI